MADRTHIEWCHATVNAISGCTPISPGCTNCYAMRAGGHKRPHHPSNGLTMPSKAGHVWTGAVRLNDAWLRRPLSWQKPRRIFWNAHGDPWHEAVPVEWIDREFAVAALTPHHRHLFLTKRSALMRAYITDVATPERVLDQCRYLGGLPTRWQWPLPNVWLGVSVEDQARADERIPDLLATPAAIRFASAEPLLGRIRFSRLKSPDSTWLNALTGFAHAGAAVFQQFERGLDWIIAGGESGPGARPMHPRWALFLRDQCAEYGVPFLVKQWGDWTPVECVPSSLYGVVFVPPFSVRGAHKWRRWDGDICRTPTDDESVSSFFAPGTLAVPIGKKAAGRLLDGELHDAYPELFAWEQRERAA